MKKVNTPKERPFFRQTALKNPSLLVIPPFIVNALENR